MNFTRSRARQRTARTRLALICAAASLAGCGPQTAATTDTPVSAADAARPAQPSDPRIIPIPDIPAVLRGCWIGNEDPEHPRAPERLIVTESGFTLDGREAKPDYVNRVAKDWIDGRFAASNGDTMATMLELDGARRNDAASDTLILREGDAGSYNFSRCRP
jgi:hypothetical protein